MKPVPGRKPVFAFNPVAFLVRPGCHSSSRPCTKPRLPRAEAVKDAQHRRSRLVLDGFEHGGMLMGAGAYQQSLDPPLQLLGYYLSSGIYVRFATSANNR